MRMNLNYIWRVCLTDVNEARLQQSPFKGEDVFKRQLQVGVNGFGILLLIIFVLCELMILAKLGMEL